jgi:hypothetical protein
MKHQARLNSSLELNRASTSRLIAVVLEAKSQWVCISSLFNALRILIDNDLFFLYNVRMTHCRQTD